MKLAIVGMGKMGHAIAELAPSRGWDVVAQLDEVHAKSGITRDSLANADVAVEFSVPEAAPTNIRAIVAAGIPVVVGTTGWYKDFDAIRADVQSKNGALLTATNFSLGVNIFEQIAAKAAQLLSKTPGFEAALV